MKTYSFISTLTISVNIDVEAKSLKDAVAQAQSAGVMSLCHQCSSNHEGEWSTSGEFDGVPMGLEDVIVDGESVTPEQLAKAKKLWSET